MHLDSRGKLKQSKVLPIKNVPMVHDFMITKKYLVLLLPSFRFDKAKFMNKHSAASLPQSKQTLI
jgi:carotenoid cleavage dioxygenase-like enzyme